ncbi:MAG: hypothetical protein EP344_08895 [Bacteroidetes bacterium]|nr:MAG: hypothetical protein EP344_08895 [Bacteroidota bacterium]
MAPQSQTEDRLRITENIRLYWREASQWGMFFSILGFTYIGILITGIMLFGGYRVPGYSIVTLLLLGGIVFIPTWLMFQFGQNIRKALRDNDTAAASMGFTSLRRLYQLIGILVVFLLFLYVFLFLLGLLMVGSDI